MHHRQRRIERIKANQEPFLAPNSAINFKSFQSPRDGHSAIKKNSHRSSDEPALGQPECAGTWSKKKSTHLASFFFCFCFVCWFYCCCCCCCCCCFICWPVGKATFNFDSRATSSFQIAISIALGLVVDNVILYRGHLLNNFMNDKVHEMVCRFYRVSWVSQV